MRLYPPHPRGGEFFSSGGGGVKPDPKGFTEIYLCDRMQMFIN